MKRKLVALVLVLALATSGCAFFKTVKDFMCKPTEAQKMEATLMLAAIDAIQAAGGMFFPPIALVKASAVLKVIQSGGCFLVAELEEIFKILDAAEASKAMAMGFRAPTKVETYPALRKTLRK